MYFYNTIFSYFIMLLFIYCDHFVLDLMLSNISNKHQHFDFHMQIMNTLTRIIGGRIWMNLHRKFTINSTKTAFFVPKRTQILLNLFFGWIYLENSRWTRKKSSFAIRKSTQIVHLVHELNNEHYSFIFVFGHFVITSYFSFLSLFFPSFRPMLLFLLLFKLAHYALCKHINIIYGVRVFCVCSIIF